MKKSYQIPTIEVLKMLSADVIAASPEEGDNPADGVKEDVAEDIY